MPSGRGLADDGGRHQPNLSGGTTTSSQPTVLTKWPMSKAGGRTTAHDNDPRGVAVGEEHGERMAVTAPAGDPRDRLQPVFATLA